MKNRQLFQRDPAISKLHAIFHHYGEEWLIEDRCSTNGTFLNETWLGPGEKHLVTDGAMLRLGNAIRARFFEPSSLWSFCKLVRGSSSDLQPVRP